MADWNSQQKKFDGLRHHHRKIREIDGRKVRDRDREVAGSVSSNYLMQKVDRSRSDLRHQQPQLKKQSYAESTIKLKKNIKNLDAKDFLEEVSRHGRKTERKYVTWDFEDQRKSQPSTSTEQRPPPSTRTECSRGREGFGPLQGHEHTDVPADGRRHAHIHLCENCAHLWWHTHMKRPSIALRISGLTSVPVVGPEDSSALSDKKI